MSTPEMPPEARGLPVGFSGRLLVLSQQRAYVSTKTAIGSAGDGERPYDHYHYYHDTFVDSF